MTKRTIEADFIHNNQRCIIMRFDREDDGFGLTHRCGYVGVQPFHPLWGKNYNAPIENPSPELVAQVHNTPIEEIGIMAAFLAGLSDNPIQIQTVLRAPGGITFADSGSYPVPSIAELWWFGFDCGHYGQDHYEPNETGALVNRGCSFDTVRRAVCKLADQLQTWSS